MSNWLNKFWKRFVPCVLGLVLVLVFGSLCVVFLPLLIIGLMCVLIVVVIGTLVTGKDLVGNLKNTRNSNIESKLD